MTHAPIIFLISLVLAVLSTWVMRKIAPFTGYLDLPGSQRFHEKVTPLLGGAAVFLTLSIVGLGLHLDIDLLGQQPGQNPVVTQYANFFLGLTTLFLLGLVDDRVSLPPTVKLAGQFFVALAFYFGGLRVSLFEWELLNACLGIVWVIGIVNAMNLLDNIDGLCGAISLVAAGFFTAFLAGMGNTPMALLGVMTMGAVVGFLTQNFRDAKIFLGDAGSMLLGGLLAGLGLMCVKSGDLGSHLSVTMVLAMPILDTTLVSVHRSLNGQNVLHGGKDHLSHRLANHYGLGATRAVLLIGAGGLAAGAAGLLARYLTPGGAFTLWGFGLMGLVGTVAAFKGTYDYQRRGLTIVPDPQQRVG